jgi:aminoglycoside 6'-N-acetyltransferase I
MRLDFEILKKGAAFPYDLLLLADETVDAINKYLFDSTVYLVKSENELVGVFCLYKIDENTIELKNIAVSEEFQGKGLGSAILNFIKEECRKNYKKLLVGTADCGFRQIHFYEMNGFEKYAVRKDFFVENYDLLIFENGVQLKDMVVLKYDLI